MSALNGCGSVGASVYSMRIKVDHRTSQGPPDSSSNMNWEGVFSEMPFELASDTDPLQLFQVASLSQIVKYGDKYLRVRKIEDWPNALNGLQIENSGNITKIGAAVDVSTRVLTAAAKQHVDLLIVHHGLFWPGLQPITGGLRPQEKIDMFITGEAPHWAAVAAEELGINLLLGGHYATETFGVKAMAARLSKRFNVPWEFLDFPTGL